MHQQFTAAECKIIPDTLMLYSKFQPSLKGPAGDAHYVYRRNFFLHIYLGETEVTT